MSDRRSALCAAVIALPVLLHPPSLNQGVYLYVGQVILDGGLPYQDVFEPKGPLLYLAYAALQAILPFELVPGVFQYLACLASGVLAARLVGGERSSPVRWCVAGMVAAALPAWSSYEGLSASPLWSGEAEDLTTPLVLGGLLLMRADAGRCAGLLFGLALVTKQTEALVLLAVVTERAWSGHRRLAFRVLSWAAMPPLLVAGVFAAQGAFMALWRAAVAWPILGYRGVDPGAGPLRALGAALDFERARLVMVGWSVLLLGLIRRFPASPGPVGAAFVGAFGSALVQGRGWPYQFELALALAAVLLGRALVGSDFEKRWAGRFTSMAVTVALVMGLAVGTPGAYFEGWRSLGQALTKGRQEAQAGFTDIVSTERELRHLGAELRSRARPGDLLYVFAMHARLHLDSGLPPPGRFVFALPLVASGPLAEGLRAEEASAIAARPPRFVVYTAHPSGGPEPPPSLGPPPPPPTAIGLLLDGQALLPRFPALHDLILAEGYAPVARFGALVLLERGATASLEPSR